MTIHRMHHVGVVVDDLEAATVSLSTPFGPTAFFVELGMELEGEAHVEGRWVDRVVGLARSRSRSRCCVRGPAGIIIALAETDG